MFYQRGQQYRAMWLDINKSTKTKMSTVSLLASVPFGVFCDLYSNNFRGPSVVFCREMWPSAFAARASQMYVVVMTYVIPLSVIMVCYLMMLRRLWKNKSFVRPSCNINAQVNFKALYMSSNDTIHCRHTCLFAPIYIMHNAQCCMYVVEC